MLTPGRETNSFSQCFRMLSAYSFILKRKVDEQHVKDEADVDLEAEKKDDANAQKRLLLILARTILSVMV